MSCFECGAQREFNRALVRRVHSPKEANFDSRFVSREEREEREGKSL
jgi:hypothetical protein